MLREEGERGKGVVELAGWFYAMLGERESERGRPERYGVAVALRRRSSADGLWSVWANQVAGRRPGRAGGARREADGLWSAGQKQGRGGRAERERERDEI